MSVFGALIAGKLSDDYGMRGLTKWGPVEVRSRMALCWGPHCLALSSLTACPEPLPRRWLGLAAPLEPMPREPIGWLLSFGTGKTCPPPPLPLDPPLPARPGPALWHLLRRVGSKRLP